MKQHYFANILSAMSVKKIFMHGGLYVILTLLLISNSVKAQVSVTATAGTTGPTAYTTLGAAFAALNAGTHNGAITVSITASTTETAQCVLNASGSGAANYTSVLIRPAAGTTPVIAGTIASGPVIRLNGGANITIDGSNNGSTSRDLTIRNNSATSSNVLLIGSVGTVPVNNITVRNCVIINGTNTSTAVLIGDAAVVGSPGYFSNISFTNNDVRRAYIGLYIYSVVSALLNNVTIADNDINTPGTEAIRLVGVYVQGAKNVNILRNRIGNFETASAEFDRAIWLATATTATTISQNTVSGLRYSGTSSYAPIGINISPGVANANITVSENEVTNLSSSGTGSTMGMFVYSALSGVVIEKNKVYNIKNSNTSGYGSSGILCAATVTTANVAIRNNFVWDVASYGYNGYESGDNGNGIVLDGGGGYTLDNNTVVLNTEQTLTGAHRASALLITANISGSGVVTLRNNILANLQTVGNANSRLAISNLATNGTGVFSSINYNDYYSTSTNLSSTGTNASITNTLAQLQTSLGGNANSVNIQPVFVGANDLHLTQANNPGLINAALPLAAITDDIDGDARSATGPSIGADEIRITRFYVDATGGNDNNSGASWGSALRTVTKALNSANIVSYPVEIWVKSGTYYPMGTPTTVMAANRDSSFRIKRSDITMYGGFAGTETAPGQRNIAANPTILSGDIGTLNNTADNVYHVLTATYTGSGSQVNGFIIEKGNADGAGSFTVNAMALARNSGGGIYNRSVLTLLNSTVRQNNAAADAGGIYNVQASFTMDSSFVQNNSATGATNNNGGGGMKNSNAQNITIRNTIFTNNSAIMDGGAINTQIAVSVDIRKSVFTGNSAGDDGAGIYNNRTDNFSISNSVIASNIATDLGGGVYNTDYVRSEIINSTLYANVAANGGGLFNQGLVYNSYVYNSIIYGNSNGIGSNTTGTTEQVNNCIVQGGYAGTANLDVDPQFMNSANAAGADNIWRTADDGLQLSLCSKALDAGNNSYIPAGVTTDILGNARIQNAIVDAGAYEKNYVPYDVSIAANPDMTSTVCSGTSIQFTATPVNQGANTPAYQWLINGSPVAGANSSTYSSTTLVNGDVVSVAMTPDFGCTATADTSNLINIVLTPSVTPAVSIIASQATICTGGSVTFTATPVNGGSTPAYQWLVNGGNAGTNSNTFTSTTLNDNDVVAVVLTSNETCVTAATANSNSITMTVSAPVTASVSISASQNNICTGSSVTFTATPVNGGTAPSYQWLVNGGNAGTNSNTFTSNTLNNNDVVSVVLTSNASCLSSNNVSSNSVTMSVIAAITPSVSISASQNNICAGSSVTFTATPVNGGTAPSYQWLVNGGNAGTNSNTFTSTTLNNNDQVSVVLTSSETCVSVNNVASNTVTMTVNNNLTPAVSISASQTSICAGSSVTFTATPVNGGSAASYQWLVNGGNAGANSNTFTSTTLNNNDVVSVVLTSSETCVTAATASSNTVTMSVAPVVTPSVSIAASQTTICAGNSVSFTASPVNGGTTPSYQWQVNGGNTGTNNATFTSNTLSNGDVITVILISSETCPTTNNVSSNAISMTVNNNITPTVSIAASQNNICAGTAVTFTATTTGQGSTPVYQWMVNGGNAGSNSPTFTSSTLNNNDVVTVRLTSSETCLAANNIVSNGITMQVNPLLTPSANITVSQQTICAGSSVNFTATAVNGGSNPSYQWKVNGGNVGTNSNIYTSATLNNSDVVTVVLTSNATCLATNNVSSNGITMQVNPNLTPSVSITASKTLLCGGEAATFSATPVNGGSNPSYQWQINGGNAGTNSSQFTYAAFSNNDVVTVILTSSETCLTGNNVVSNGITITIAPNPVLTLTADNPEILAGGTTQLHTASTETIATYAWQPAASLSSASVADPLASPQTNTTYTLNVTSTVGCRASASIQIKVVQGPLIANTFSPNGDGINELWLIKNLETYPNCKVQVFTRTGQLVFESRGYRQPWNGTFKGKSLPLDTYYYIIELNNRIDSKPVTGYVTIIK
ncbi:MAG: gliding motility-associated C-terminal domain-containing protein [Ferruginibacter sp.]